MMDRAELIGELLTTLEAAEVRLMAWGFVDVIHTGEEIATLFGNHPELGQHFREAAEQAGEELWIDDLVSAGLLFRVSFGPPSTYRSRFAESTRLLLRLRQRFRHDDWATAPELVSDARFYLGPRHFPVRNVEVPAAWRSLAASAWNPELQRDVFTAACGGVSRLAAFQVRAASRILDHYRGLERFAGTVITAGTGGGKTKAFYIPALMGVAADIVADSRPATHVLSVYPRNVLLSDQFAEVTRLAMAVNTAVGNRLARPVRVGALIGDVPFTPDFEGDFRNRFQMRSWPRPNGVPGHRVPHLRDPATGRPLVWLDKDRHAGRTTLRLEHAPERVAVPNGTVGLTREEMRSRPPDILLTSIEMINKDLSSELGRDVLGFGTGSCPLRLVLLDEIHTYEGLTGAQVPWILRRLTYWTRGYRRTPSLHVVGLSATLQDAPSHLATLSGAPEDAIVEIAPDGSANELTTEGQEYNLVIKSHPGSGAGVLATSIQTVMLGSRILTPLNHPPQSGSVDGGYFFGRKVFGFTDNLDVVNRWLPDFCDAEQTRGLAALRASRPGDQPRWAAGQVWRLSEQLKHNLAVPVRVGRTSSQDPGIDADAEVVLATSALEVGFDDDEVGMVVQHKAPRSAASFLQRKGRAGRRKGMRPWTIVVLSEHGRDRWAFRDSERLFAPSLERLSLPVFNPYVLRIQATWFLVDWIARRVGRGIPALYLARRDYFDVVATRVVRELVDQADVRAELTKDLADWIRSSPGGVRVADAERLAHDLLWTPPRAVLRHVVPTLWNHLEGDVTDATAGRQRLLPQFLPERTWEVLDTQDAELSMPNGEQHTMDVRQALRECVPGRVSRRYAIGRTEPSKWLAWSAQLLNATAPTEVAADLLLGHFAVSDELADVTIFQPTGLALGDVPPSVKKSSNAEWVWECTVRPNGEPSAVALHAGPVARSIFSGGACWLHREQSRLLVYRFASAFRYELLMDRNQTRRGFVSVVPPAANSPGRRAAIGFVRSVDGIELRVREDVLAASPALPTELLASLRPVYFRYMAMRSEVLNRCASPFSINLLVTSALGMLVATALRQGVQLPDAWKLISNKPAAAGKVLASVLAGEVDDGLPSPVNPGRRVQDITALWLDAAVVGEMDKLITCLWDPLGEDWKRWLRGVFLDTVRAAVEATVQSVLPEVPEGDFSVEVLDEPHGASLWILEAEAGGIGIVDRLLAELSLDPSLFDTALDSNLGVCPAERIVDNVARSVNESLRRSSPACGAFAEVRAARSYNDFEAARLELQSALLSAGCDVDREAIAALLGKALIPGSSAVTDRWIRRLTAGRATVTRRLGITIDARVWAYWTTSSPKRRDLMARTLTALEGGAPSDEQITSAVVRLTLDPCRDSCPSCLGSGREMQGLVPSRRLVKRWLNLSDVELVIVVGQGDEWLGQLDSALIGRCRIRVRCGETDRDRVGAALVERLAKKHDRGYVLSGFRVAAVTKTRKGWETLIAVDDMEVL